MRVLEGGGASSIFLYQNVIEMGVQLKRLNFLPTLTHWLQRGYSLCHAFKEGHNAEYVNQIFSQ